MTFRQERVTIDADGRDKGKVFEIKELPALQVEKWGHKTLCALAKKGVIIPDEVMKMGLIGVMMVGPNEFHRIDWVDLEPLLDEMFSSVRYIPTPSNANISTPIMIDTIMEVSTLTLLRGAIFRVHLGFSHPGSQ